MNSKKEVQHVYLVGAKSLGAYGGYETFVYKLTEYHQNKENIKYHVACKANGDGCILFCRSVSIASVGVCTRPMVCRLPYFLVKARVPFIPISQSAFALHSEAANRLSYSAPSFKESKPCWIAESSMLLIHSRLTGSLLPARPYTRRKIASPSRPASQAFTT